MQENYKIKNMDLSPGGKYLGVIFNSGLSILLDCTNLFKLALKLENNFDESYLGFSVYKSKVFFSLINTIVYPINYLFFNKIFDY